MGAHKKLFEDHFARLDSTDPNTCWLWPLSDNGNGYGQLTSDYKKHKAHRYFYEALIGPVPDGMVLDHLCHDPNVCEGGTTCPHRLCCNPAHMQVTTQGENVRRGGTNAFKNAAKTQCKNGHAFTPENTLIRPHGGGRSCRECGRQRARRYYKEKQAA